MGVLYNEQDSYVGRFESAMVFDTTERYIGFFKDGIIYRVDGEHHRQIGYIKGERIYRGLTGASTMVGYYRRGAVYSGFGNYAKSIASYEVGDPREAAAAALLLCDFSEDIEVPKDTFAHTLGLVVKDSMKSTVGYFGYIALFVGRIVTRNVAPFLSSFIGIVGIIGVITLAAILYYLYLGIQLYVGYYSNNGFWLMAGLQFLLTIACCINAKNKGETKTIRWIVLQYLVLLSGTVYLYWAALNTMQYPLANSLFEWWSQLYPFMLFCLWVGFWAGVVFQYAPYTKNRIFLLPVLGTLVTSGLSILFIVFYDLKVSKGILFGICYLVLNIWVVALLSLPGMAVTFVMIESRQSIPFGVPMETDLYGYGRDGIPNVMSQILSLAELRKKEYLRVLRHNRITEEQRLRHMEKLSEEIRNLNGAKTEGRGLIEEVGEDYVLLRINFPYYSKSASSVIKLYPKNTLTNQNQSELKGAFVSYCGQAMVENLNYYKPIKNWSYVVTDAEILDLIPAKRQLTELTR